MNLNPNLVKYRTNYFQCKYLNEHTPKIILCEDIVPRVFHILPQINGTSNIPIQEQEMEQATEQYPILTYIDEDSEDSDYSDSE